MGRIVAEHDVDECQPPDRRADEDPPEAGAPPHWLAYISSPDVDATAQQAESLGAKMMVEPDRCPDGRELRGPRDPQGAMFAIFIPSSETPGHEGPPAQGEFSWHELATREQPAAFRATDQRRCATASSSSVPRRATRPPWQAAPSTSPRSSRAARCTRGTAPALCCLRSRRVLHPSTSGTYIKFLVLATVDIQIDLP